MPTLTGGASRDRGQTMGTLEQLRFDNAYARLPEGFGVLVRPVPPEGLFCISASPGALDLLDLSPAEAERPAFLDAFSGRRPLPGMDPMALVYAGHQFGVYVPRLGDGR